MNETLLHYDANLRATAISVLEWAIYDAPLDLPAVFVSSDIYPDLEGRHLAHIFTRYETVTLRVTDHFGAGITTFHDGRFHTRPFASEIPPIGRAAALTDR